MSDSSLKNNVKTTDSSLKIITDPRIWTPQRIIFVLDSLGLGGSSYAALHTALGLKELGCKLLILTRHGGERLEAFNEVAEQVYINRWAGVRFLGRAALAVCSDFKPDLIHAQGAEVAAVAVKIAETLRVPVVTTVNRLEIPEIRFLAKATNLKLVAITDTVQERLSNNNGIHRSRIKVVPNCLCLEKLPAPKVQTSTAGRAAVVGLYGLMEERKGQRVFLHAAAQILRSGIDAEYILLGSGPDRPYLRHLASELGIASRVNFSPSTTHDTSSITNFDVFVEPTLQDGLGLSVLQAMALGVPVVASGVGGIFSLIEDGTTGLLVKPGDADAITQAICRLLANSSLRSELARLARLKVEKDYRAKNVAQKLLQAYAEWMDPQLRRETQTKRPTALAHFVGE